NGIARVAFDHEDSLRSIEFIISWLTPTPHATAVYASCSASPPPHATLASRRLARPYLGRTFTGWIAPACGWRTHSITSSAIASIVGGISRPRFLAALRLMTNSNFTDCITGKPASFPPRRILPAYTPP